MRFKVYDGHFSHYIDRYNTKFLVQGPGPSQITKKRGDNSYFGCLLPDPFNPS